MFTKSPFFISLFFLFFSRALLQKNVGCFFTQQLCQQNEICFDDNVFGQCGESAEEIWKKYLSEEKLSVLEREMKRLFFFGFRWDNSYTQCIVKQLLSDEQVDGVSLYDPGLCIRPLSTPSSLSDLPSSVNYHPPTYSDYAFESFQHQQNRAKAPVASSSPLTSNWIQRESRVDTKKPGPAFSSPSSNHKLNKKSKHKQIRKDDHQYQQTFSATAVRTEEEEDGETLTVDSSQTFVSFRESGDGERFVIILEQLLNLPRGTFSNIKAREAQVTFKVNPNPRGFNASTVASKIEKLREVLNEESGLEITATGIGDSEINRVEVIHEEAGLRKLTIIATVSFLALLALALIVLFIGRRRRVKKVVSGENDKNEKEDGAVENLYQELCRQRMQCEGNRCTEELDIGTGHLVLRVMEEYAKENGERLKREWDSLCSYDAEGETRAGNENMARNRFNDVLPFDHSRIILNDLENGEKNDYINASSIIDHDPRNATYILTQGPLQNTAPDFWQMVYEQSVVIIVNLTRLQENGVEQCYKYWPDSGSHVYGDFEVHLVSEHIWSDDFLVRSFYLKNLKTLETRTVSQFHFLSWPTDGLPNDPKALLDFRRKVNKSFRGRCSPIIVHCSDGVGRSGTYCLLDMVLSRVLRGAKEIDLEATLEHIRDQRGGAVRTRAQYEFVLKSLADEIQSFLK